MDVLILSLMLGLTIIYIALCVLLYLIHKRNIAVYEFRQKVLHEESMEVYESMPDYDEMMRKWWIPLKIENWAYKEEEHE